MPENQVNMSQLCVEFPHLPQSGERALQHVSPIKPIFPKGGPSSLRERVVEKEKAYEVYHSSYGFSWSKVSCGITQIFFPKAI